MTIEEFNHELSRTLDGDCRLLCGKPNPPARSVVTELGHELGVTLPDGYVAFQNEYGAAYIEVKEAAWPRPKEYQGGPYWSFLYACMVFGIGDGVPERIDVRHQTSRLATDLGAAPPFRLVPLFRWECSADRVCTDADGELYEVSHATADKPTLIEVPFLDYVIGQVRDLVVNKGRLRAEVPSIFKTDADRFEERRAAAMKDVKLTDRRCPECGSPCPGYRSKCKVCGFAIGRETR